MLYFEQREALCFIKRKGIDIMKNYEKPVVMVNEGLAEGVYTASGVLATCWTVRYESVQSWDGAEHVFEFKVNHITGVEHNPCPCRKSRSHQSPPATSF